MKHNISLATALFTAAAFCGNNAYAISITGETDANALAAALTAGSSGLTVISATLSGHTAGGAVSSGTFTNTTNTYGIGAGIVLSSGNVNDYNDGPNTNSEESTNFNAPATAAQEALLDPITGGAFNHFDVTQLDIWFTTSTSDVYFNVVFGSEEFPEYVDTSFIDGFGLYLDGINIAFVGGLPVNIKHPAMTSVIGTELDGILAPNNNPLLTFSASGLDTSLTHNLTFIVGDAADSSLDTTVYIASLGGTPPTAPVPEPATLSLLGLGLGSLALAANRRRTTGSVNDHTAT